MANTTYTAAPSLVATNTTQQLSITTDTKLSVTAPWLASGNSGTPDISTTLATTALAGSSSLTLLSGDNFPTSYPSIYQQGIYFLPPSVGRLAGSVTSGTNVIPFVPREDMPTALPIFVRLGSEILQVTSFGNTTVGSTGYVTLNTATNTGSSHPDFTPIHLNSLPTDIQYSQIEVPNFYLADGSASGTMSGQSNTISTGSIPSTMGVGQTITTTTGGTTYLPVGTTVTAYGNGSGLVTLSSTFSTPASGLTFSNSATFAATINPPLITGFASISSTGGGTHTVFSSFPNVGSAITGTGIPATTYISGLDAGNIRMAISNNPTAYTSAVALTSTLTFTVSSTRGSTVLTLKTITVNGTSYPKVGTTNPTWNGRTLAYYLKVGAPISGASPAISAVTYITGVNVSNGTVIIASAATATVTTSTVTSTITCTANTGRAVVFTPNASSEINKLLVVNSTIANTGATNYVTTSTTISKIVTLSATQSEIWMSAASGTTGAWTTTLSLGSTFSGTSSFSNQITGVTNASTLYQVGSLVYGNQYIPDNTTISGISGTTITLSNTLTNGFSTITGATFKVGSSLNVGKTYTTLPVTPLPCLIPSGTTLYLTYGNFVQNLVTSATAYAGDATMTVNSFQPRFNFSTTSYSYGVARTSTGDYGYGANLTVGLNSDLFSGQALILQTSGSNTTTLIADGYTRQTARVIKVKSFVSAYAYDGQSVGFSTTGTFTGGSSQITSVGATASLAVGQQVFSTALPTMAKCFITAISGSTVTISSNAIASGTVITFSVYSNSFTASVPMTLDTGSVQEVIFPISLPTLVGNYWSVNLSAPTMYQHNNGSPLVYYHYPTPLHTGDVTYRPDFGKFLMWDGFQWRTARVNALRGVYSILGAVGGGDVSSITLYDPNTNKETAADTYKGTPSTDYSTYFGGYRSVDPNGDEWMGNSILNIKFHLTAKVPQGKSIGYRSLALQSEYKSAPLVANINFSPGDNFEISPNVTNSVFWLYSDIDGEPQAGWEVRIYDDYTYHRSDFDPDNSAIIPFWKASGSDDTTEVEITGADGWVNGERYWAYIRVAKQFHQKQWWGDWNYQRFLVTVDQPVPPIMSVFTDNTNSYNKLAIQSTDNLLGENNGSFGSGLGQWSITSNDTASSGINDLIEGIPLGSTLSTSGLITSLPVGATGYVKTQGALSGTGTGTFTVSNTASGGGDAIGFPTSGTFWVAIDSENILVTNKLDGNNTSDTFTIVQRGYKNPNTGTNTTAATHAVGATVSFGLQNPIYVGSVASVKFSQHKVTDFTTTTTANVRNYNGRAAYTEPKQRTALQIVAQTQGADKDTTDHVIVNDPQRLLSSADVGSSVVLSLRSWHYADKNNVITVDANGNRTVVAQAKPDHQLTGKDVREITMTIKSVRDIWDDTQNKQGKVTIATVSAQVAGSVASGALYAIHQLSVTPLVAKDKIFVYDSSNSCIANNFLPTGTQLKISASSIHDPVANKDLPAASMMVTLTKDWHPTDTTIHIRSILKAPGFRVGNGSCFIIPKGASITWSPPLMFTGRKRVTFTSRYGQKRSFFGQKLTPGDGFYVLKGRYFPAIANTATGYHNQTQTTSGQTITDTDSQQDFVVDFLTQPTVATGGVLGTLTSSSFTIATSATYSYNAIAFASTPGSVSGAYVSTPGLSPNSIAAANPTTVVGGTYAGYFAVTFTDLSGATAYVTTQNSNVTSNVVSNPVYTGITATFVPTNNLKISAGSQSIPVRPLTPNFAYPANVPISIVYPTIYTGHALAVQPTTGTGSDNKISEISLYPTGWNFTDQNPVAVNAGQTYGFAAYSKIASGSGTPTFSPRVDWYDEVGSLLKSSYGTESLTNPGTINSVTISVQMNTSTNLWGQGWNPIAMVATAPTISLGSATFVSGASSTGTFTLGSNLTFTIKAGATIYDSTNSYTVTSDALLGQATITVRFTSGISVPSSTLLSIKATRAVPALRWTNVKAADVYAVSGVMFKALNAPSLGSNSTSSTEIPALSAAITVGATQVNNAFPIPSTTPIAGVNTLYVFDPVGDYNTRELHAGGTLKTLWTSTTGAVALGATQVTLNSVDGLAPGVPLIFDYGAPTQETVVVDSSWSGGAVVPIAAPYFTKSHAATTRVYSYVAGLASEVTVTQAVNTPVAVFNYGPDGYIASNTKTYQYKVEKSEDGGQTWTTLRHGNTLKADDTGVAYITDYEAVPGLATYYRATATHYVPPLPASSDYTVTGAPSAQLKANVISNSNWWLASTSDDSLRYPMLVKTGYSETQKHPSGVFYPLGSSRPITIAGVPTGRDGSLTVTWTDLANFSNFLSLLNKGETLVLVNPVESDRKYIFINQDVSITHNAANSPYREITINYVEAAPPNFGYTYGS